MIRNGLRWRDTPEAYGPHKTLYNRFARWSRMGVFARILYRGQPGLSGGSPNLTSNEGPSRLIAGQSVADPDYP